MNFGTVLTLVFVLILATNSQQINPAQQQVLFEIYNSCTPNCPPSISSGTCDFNSTSANQCLCSSGNVQVSCNSNGNITALIYFIPFLFVFFLFPFFSFPLFLFLLSFVFILTLTLSPD